MSAKMSAKTDICVFSAKTAPKVTLITICACVVLLQLVRLLGNAKHSIRFEYPDSKSGYPDISGLSGFCSENPDFQGIRIIRIIRIFYPDYPDIEGNTVFHGKGTL